jgi:hypothetical protein
MEFKARSVLRVKYGNPYRNIIRIERMGRRKAVDTAAARLVIMQAGADSVIKENRIIQ